LKLLESISLVFPDSEIQGAEIVRNAEFYAGGEHTLAAGAGSGAVDGDDHFGIGSLIESVYSVRR
jgi:hypothetical protein